MEKKGKNFWFSDKSRAINLTSVEAEIMRVVWDLGKPVTVREVYEIQRERRRLAYTTVMSVMGKLAKKGILVQDRTGAAYVYSPVVSDAEVAGSIVEGVVDKILAGASGPVISRLLGSGKKLTPEQMESLEKLLKKQKE